MAKTSSRRTFLQTAPLAALSLPLAEKMAAAEPPMQAAAPAAANAQHPGYQLFTEEQISASRKKLAGTPGNDNLYQLASLPFTIVLTTEEKKSAKEFEWHEGRDHILQVLEGSTVYELGGKPQNGRNTKAQEWLAPASEGATTITLHKGDMLVIPRSTPHKRSTADRVTFYLISTTGSAS